MTTHRMRRLQAVTSCFGFALLLGGTALAEGDGKQPSQSSSRAEPQSDVERTAGEERAAASTAMGQASVKQLQRELASRNLYHGKIDGIFGPQTREALENFQTQQGIPSSGTLDERSADALGISSQGQSAAGGERQPVAGSERMPATGSQPAQGADTRSGDMGATAGSQSGGMMGASNERSIELTSLATEDAKKLQQRMKELGLYQGAVDGVIGRQTRAALQSYFQQQARLVAQGRLSDSAADVFGVSESERQPTSGQ